MVEVRVRSLGLDKATNNPVLILEEAQGDRVLPIWIGAGEASAIAMKLGEVTFTRPLTHDLLVSLIRDLGGSLVHVHISGVEQGTYFAELIVDRGGEAITIDARPSDSVAIALRCKVPIFVQDELLSTVQVGFAEEELALGPKSLTVESSGSEEQASTEGMTPEELQRHLKQLGPEDFGRFKP